MAASSPAPAVRRAVLWVPDWPVAAAVLEGLLDVAAPAAIHDQRGILVASAAARRAGVTTGMRRRVAQGLCPELTLLPADPVRDARSFEPLIQAAETVVAEVEVLRPGLLVMPARGPARYLGSEEALAEELVGAVADETGVECQVGVADGLLAAVLAARDGILVPTGAGPEYLAGQDVGALAHATAGRAAAAEIADLVDLLRRLGLRRLGDLAALDAGDVAARLGGVGLRARHLARGGDERPPAGSRPEEDVQAQVDLDPPAERSDRAAFAARALAEQLAERLLRRGAACGRLRVRARTEDGAELTRTWLLDGPASAAELTDRVRWQLDGWLAGRSGAAPSAPLTRLELLALEVGPAGVVQDGLWGRARRGELQAGRAALRVQGMLGPDGVLVPVLQGGRDPRSRARLVVWGDEPVPLRPPDAPWPGSLPEPWPATVPAEPIPVDVLDAAGRRVGVDARARISAPPMCVVRRVDGDTRVGPGSGAGAGAGGGRGRRPAGRGPGGGAGGGAGGAPTGARYEGRVRGWAGPWPVVERWWEAGGGGHRRAHLQVELDDAPALLLTLTGGAWQVDGVYD